MKKVLLLVITLSLTLILIGLVIIRYDDIITLFNIYFSPDHGVKLETEVKIIGE